MNEITKEAVKEAARRNPSMSKKAANGDTYWVTQFNYKIVNEWGNLIFGNISWKLRRRAEHIFRLERPDMFDEDEVLKDFYFDETCFVPMVERIIQTHLSNHPELDFEEDYTDYLNTIHPKQLELF